jgi:hypothetical protein
VHHCLAGVGSPLVLSIQPAPPSEPSVGSLGRPIASDRRRIRSSHRQIQQLEGSSRAPPSELLRGPGRPDRQRPSPLDLSEKRPERAAARPTAFRDLQPLRRPGPRASPVYRQQYAVFGHGPPLKASKLLIPPTRAEGTDWQPVISALGPPWRPDRRRTAREVMLKTCRIRPFKRDPPL